jgi:arylsulfatase A-like enzyme
MYTRAVSLTLMWLVATRALAQNAAPNPGAKPNIVFILMDNLGYGEVPDPTAPSNGCSGPWRGYYFTHMEGLLRTPFIIRWPGKIPAGRVDLAECAASNESAVIVVFAAGTS